MVHPFHIVDFDLPFQPSLQALERSDDFTGCSVIVRQQCLRVIRIGTYQGYPFQLLQVQRQGILLILQQDHRLAGHFISLCLVRRTFQYLPAYREIRITAHISPIKQSYLEENREQPFQGNINVLLRKIPLVHSLFQQLIQISTFQVRTIQHSIADGQHVIRMCLVVMGKVIDGSTVGSDITIEFPLIT